MKIERQDKQLELREAEIQKNWRDCARRNTYMQRDPILVEAGEASVSLEVWASGDTGLIYLPPMPRATGGNVLYIANTLDEMLETVKQLVFAALLMIQVKREQREERARLN